MIYVDDMDKRFGRYLMSHMIADTIIELHQMADSIGVARKWFQGDHYDVCRAKKAKAISLGAKPITWRDCGLMMVRRHREGCHVRLLTIEEATLWNAMSKLDKARTRAREWRDDHREHVDRLVAIPGVAYPPSGLDLIKPELWKAAHWRWLAHHDDRPTGFVEERRKHCTSPRVCFEFGDVEPFCGPCDEMACSILSGRSALSPSS